VTPLVAWHGGLQSLVFLNPNGTPAVFFKATDLRRIGYPNTDADYRTSLPRFDVSPLARLR